jgi:hypothetical protein
MIISCLVLTAVTRLECSYEWDLAVWSIGLVNLNIHDQSCSTTHEQSDESTCTPSYDLLSLALCCAGAC